MPFWSYFDWVRGNWSRGSSIILNIILFIPFGYLLAGLKKTKRLPIIICLAVTVAIETIQYITYHGYFDIDDIISNFIGGVVGVFCFHRFHERLGKYFIPALFAVAGIVGCLISSGGKQIYETQFDFGIQSVEVREESITLTGNCSIYRRDFLPYQIQLKGEDTIYLAATEISGTQFNAVAVAPDDDYEIDVIFKGYQPISTGIYINSQRVEYVKNAPTPAVSGTDLAFLIESGILKVYNADYDAYVYQVEDRLYWLIGKHFDASIIYHLYTEELENLPEERKKYGFDNRGVKVGSDRDLTSSMDCGRYIVLSDIIPTEYSVKAIAVGMGKGPEILWREYFRVDSY